MKKRLLIFALVLVAFVCLMAISASATKYVYRDESGKTLLTINAEFATADGRYEIITSQTGEGFAKTDRRGFPLTWYVVNDVTNATTRVITVKSVKTSGEAGTITNGVYTYGSTTYPDITPDKVVSAYFKDSMNITSFNFTYQANASTKLHESEYCEIADGSYLLYLYLPTTLESIPSTLCQRTPIISCEFNANKIKATSIPKEAFQYTANLKRFIFPEGIVNVYGESFVDCHSLTYVKFPNTLRTIPDNMFKRANSISTLLLGANVVKAGIVNADYGTYSKDFSNAMTNVYVPAITERSNFDYYTVAPKNTVIYFYTGTRVDLEKSANNTSGYFADAYKSNRVLSPLEYETKKNKTGELSEKSYIVWGYNVCNAFYDSVHTFSQSQTNTCAAVCLNCSQLQQFDNPVHNLSVTLEYKDNNFIVEGKRVTKCKNNNCKLNLAPTSEQVDPLFQFHGYSVNEKGGFCVGYTINKKIISEYASSDSCTSFNFGFVAAAIDLLGNGITQPLDGNGNTTSNTVIKKDLSRTSLVSINFVFRGDWSNEKLSKLKLTMGLYALVGTENGTKVVYLMDTNDLAKPDQCRVITYYDVYNRIIA